MTAPKIQTKEQVLARLARQRRRQLAVYFFSGVLLPSPSLGYSLATSSATVTSKTLFVCFQNPSRR